MAIVVVIVVESGRGWEGWFHGSNARRRSTEWGDGRRVFCRGVHGDIAKRSGRGGGGAGGAHGHFGIEVQRQVDAGIAFYSFYVVE